MPKALTREQLQSRKEKAVRFVEDVLDDPERADEIADESLESYAARRKIEIVDNPRKGADMPTNPELARRIRKLEEKDRAKNPRRGPAVVPVASSEADTLPTRAELSRRIRELEDENDELQDRLDHVADLAEAPEDDECEAADDLKDTLNEILDVAAPGEVEDEDDENGGNA